MKNVLLIFPVMICLTSWASARLDETVAECAARYGKPDLESQDGKNKWYKKNGVSISIRFRNGKAAEISMSKASENLLDLFSKLSDLEIQAILQANAAGGQWIEKKATNSNEELEKLSGKKFTRGDGNAHARWDYATGTLHLITNAERLELIEEEKDQKSQELQDQKEKAKKTSEGF